MSVNKPTIGKEEFIFLCELESEITREMCALDDNLMEYFSQHIPSIYNICSRLRKSVGVPNDADSILDDLGFEGCPSAEDLWTYFSCEEGET